MTNLMQDGIAWLADRLKDSAGQAATYRRGASTVSLTGVWFSTPRPEEVGITGVIVERHDLLDVRMQAADLTLDSDMILPQRGDRIEITRGSVVDVYEVMSSGDEPAYWWCDTEHAMLGVHAKQVIRG